MSSLRQPLRAVFPRAEVRRESGALGLFIVLYLGMTQFLRWALALWTRSSGASAQGVDLILADNELNIQVISLFVAHYGQLWRALGVRPWGRTLIAYFFPFRPWERFAGAWSRAILWGFLAASGIVSASLFVGFSSLEGSLWPSSWWWSVGPSLFLEVAMLLAWILLLDATFLFFLNSFEFLVAGTSWRVLVRDSIAALLCGTLLYRVFQGVDPWFVRFFPEMMCYLMALGYVLWIREGSFLHGSQLQARAFRWGLSMGFLVSWCHLYGQVLGGVRFLSLFTVFPGPQTEPTQIWVQSGLLGQTFALCALVLTVNFLIQRVLKSSTQSAENS